MAAGIPTRDDPVLARAGAVLVARRARAGARDRTGRDRPGAGRGQRPDRRRPARGCGGRRLDRLPVGQAPGHGLDRRPRADPEARRQRGALAAVLRRARDDAPRLPCPRRRAALGRVGQPGHPGRVARRTARDDPARAGPAAVRRRAGPAADRGAQRRDAPRRRAAGRRAGRSANARVATCRSGARRAAARCWRSTSAEAFSRSAKRLPRAVAGAFVRRDPDQRPREPACSSSSSGA